MRHYTMDKLIERIYLLRAISQCVFFLIESNQFCAVSVWPLIEDIILTIQWSSISIDKSCLRQETVFAC